MLPSRESDSLVSSVRRVHYEDGKWWQFWHAFNFLLGGFTFCYGTALYFWPDYPGGGVESGWLYTLGSFGFLAVDLMEFWTFTDDKVLRANIGLSASGSLCYVIGSAGFWYSAYYNLTDYSVGIWGFIAGSALIAISQAWKSVRILSAPAPDPYELVPPPDIEYRHHVLTNTNRGGSSYAHVDYHSVPVSGSIQTKSPHVAVDPSVDRWTAFGVEGGAGLGALCFLIGTIMFDVGPLEGTFYLIILILWSIGSAFFTAGGCFLAYRHVVLRVA